MPAPATPAIATDLATFMGDDMLGHEQQGPEAEFQANTHRLEALVQEFEALPYPQIREKAFELLQTIDAVHRAALERLVGFLQAQGQAGLIEQAARDPLIRVLFLLYDLISADELPQAEPARNTIFIPLEQVGQIPERRLRQPVFQPVARLEEVPIGSMREFQIEELRVLVANVDGEIYAVRNHCPGSMAPLHLGTFSPPILVCPWHNEAYDIRTGKRVDGHSEPHLEILPVALANGVIQLAVNIQANPQHHNGLPRS